MSRVANKLKKSKGATISGVTARYIRLTGFERTTSFGPMITQFALYRDAACTDLIIGQDSSTYPTIPELSANVTPSSGWTANRAGSAVITSGWYLANRNATQISGDWIQYDLGSPTEIGGIRVRTGYSSNTSNYWASAFNVEYSDDGTTWSLIQDVSHTSGPNVTLLDATPAYPPAVQLAVLTVTQASNNLIGNSYHGFRTQGNLGSVSPTNLTIDGTSYQVREVTRRVSSTNYVNNDSTSSFYLTIADASDGSFPADDWFSSVIVETSGDPITLTRAQASIATVSGTREYRWFASNFTSAQLAALSAEWNGSGTSTLIIMD